MIRYWLLFISIALTASYSYAVPQQINYQGQLTRTDGSPLDTTVAITFRLYATLSGGTAVWTETHPTVIVADGLFHVLLGSVTALPDSFAINRWLGVTVGSNTEMTPRQQIVSVAHAYRVGTVDGASGGTISDKLNVGFNNTNPGSYANVFGQNNDATGTNSTVGGGYNNHARGSYSVVSGGGGSVAADSNSASGSYSTISGGAGNLASAIGATVGGGRKNKARGSYSVVAGGGGAFAADSNRADGNWSTVSGGRTNDAADDYAVVAGGNNNEARASYSAVGGGEGNIADDEHSVIGGGRFNSTIGLYAVIAGGYLNQATTQSFVGGGNYNSAGGPASTVGGGTYNVTSTSSSGTSILGGSHNTVDGDWAVIGGGAWNSALGAYSFIGGGEDNNTDGNYSTVAGGRDNTASGDYTFATGQNATAAGNNSIALGNNVSVSADSAFAWSDGSGPIFSIGSDNTFNLKANGGFRFWTTANHADDIGARLPAGGSAWIALSDSTKKRNIRLVDPKSTLEKIASLPIKQWSYSSQDESIEHIGPMAQDFWSAFHIGDDSLTISTIDPSGIALAAIQELAKQNDKLQTTNDKQQIEIAELRAMVQTLMAERQESSMKETE